jgi:hypothetical protein
MKAQLNLWLSQRARIPGVLACGLQYPDRSCFTQQWAEGFEATPLEKSLACTADVWRLLHVQGMNAQWLRWSYRDAFLYFAQRSDGVSLEVIAARSSATIDLQQVASLLVSFLEDVPHPSPAPCP